MKKLIICVAALLSSPAWAYDWQQQQWYQDQHNQYIQQRDQQQWDSIRRAEEEIYRNVPNSCPHYHITGC